MLLMASDPVVDDQILSGSAPPQEIPRVYLHGGRIFVAVVPTIVTTIVGSCVAVCLSDPSAGVGGVNHYFLPHPVTQDPSARFGSVAIPRLIEKVLASGARLEHLEAKVFGGAFILSQPAASGRHLGALNVRLAFQILWEQGIPVVAQEVEGDRGRRIVYQTDIGAAWVRRL